MKPVFQRLDQTAAFPYSTSEYARRFAWRLVAATLFKLPLPRAYAWRRFLLKSFGAKMGISAAVHSSTKILHPWLLELGDWSMISGGVTVYNLGKITIGNHTVISQDVYLCAGTHDLSHPNLPLQRPTIVIGDGVWIAAGAFIGPGVVIGQNSVVGARSVVMSDVPADVIVAGNPARVLRERPMNA